MKLFITTVGRYTFLLFLLFQPKPLFAQIQGFAVKSCEQMVNDISNIYKELFKVIPNNLKNNISTDSKQIIRLKDEHCYNENTQEKILNLLTKTVRAKSKKIAFIAPLSGKDHFVGNNLKSGYSHALKHLNKQNEIITISIDSAMGDGSALAVAILQHEVDIVIAHIDDANVSSFIVAAERTRTPTILLNHPPRNQTKSNFVNFIYPQIEVLSSALLKKMQTLNFTKLAILRPNNSQDSMVKNLIAVSKQNNFNIVYDLKYDAQNFRDIDSKIQTLLQIDHVNRADEVEKMTVLREQEGLNTQQIILPPIIDFDALYIADSIKNVRHISKMLQYHGVKKLPLIGNQSWRAEELMRPYDPFLKDAFFVDYIGRYDRLPFHVESEHFDSFFLPQNETQSIDFRLIGFRTGTVVAHAFRQRFSTKNRLAQQIRNQSLPTDVFFTYQKAFDLNGYSLWPGFIFDIAPEQMIVSTLVPYTKR